MVIHPRSYRWSSYRANAEGKACRLLVPHPVYRRLGGSALQRNAAYRELFRDVLGPSTLGEIRQATIGHFALGSERFRQQVEDLIGRRAGPAKPGRPRRDRPVAKAADDPRCEIVV